MPLSDIVNVQITRQTQSPSEVGFGTLMVLGTFKNWNDLIRPYSNLQQVSTDFNPYDLEYIAAQDYFSQPITPPLLYIGRRTVDTVGIDVETSMPSQTYTATINGSPVSISSNPVVLDSVLTLSGIITWVITFSGDFTSALTGVIVTVNGMASASVPWTTNQADTLTAIAAAIDLLGFTTSTPGTDSITVVFNAPSASSVVNGVSIAGPSQPTLLSLTQDGPLVASNVINVSVNGTPLGASPYTFASSSLATLSVIAADIASILNSSQSVYSPGVATCTVSGPNNNKLTVTSNPNQAGIISHFAVTSGASQATAAIVNTAQPTSVETIADALTTAINAATLGVTASVPSVPNGTLSITANTPGVPYTLAVSTTITNPNQARVTITQASPNQAYTVLINGTPFTYQAPNNVANNEQIAAGLVALINAPTSLVPVSATDNSNGSFEVISNSPTVGFLIQVSPFESMTIQKGLIIQPYVPSSSVVADITAIQGVNDDWYGIACTDRTKVTVEAIAAYIETQIKLFGTASDDLNIINQAAGTDTTSIAAILNNAGYVRSFVLYNEEAAIDFPECAWFGNVLP